MLNIGRTFKPYQLAVIVLLIILAGGGYIFYNLTVPVGGSDTPIKFSVQPGNSAAVVAKQLSKQNLIRSAYAFRFWTWFSARAKKFKSGDYFLLPSANAITIMKILSGEVPMPPEITLRFREGWTLKDIEDYLLALKLTNHQEFNYLTRTEAGVAKLLQSREDSIFAGARQQSSLEGYLFPDTYRFYRQVTVEQILRKLLDTFSRRLQASQPPLPKSSASSWHQVITLASIIEKEVATDFDRHLVADIFWRRLQAAIPLQADSTINYITGKKTPAVSAADLAIISPYNTYRHPGLPPGPIANPSLASLRAALEPEANQYWYFLTSADGKVFYSRTFDEHKALKAKYLK